MEVIFVSPFDQYVKKLIAAGFSHAVINVQRSGLNPLKDLITLFKLVSINKKEHPDLVHAFTSRCVGYGSLAAKLAGLIKIINLNKGMEHVFYEGS